MSMGRKGFWLGEGGLAGSVLFDRMGLKVPRTVSYALLGTGWAVWLGGYGESRSILTKFKGSSTQKSRRIGVESVAYWRVFVWFRYAILIGSRRQVMANAFEARLVRRTLGRMRNLELLTTR
jgi:hypothetical protein